MTAMHRVRFDSVGVLGLGCLLGLLGCEEDRGAGENRAAQPGITQISEADGDLLDEDEACETYRELLAEAIDDVGCDDEVELLDCPQLIRPAGASACTRFTQDSIDACEEVIEGYDSCGDFFSRRCLLVSVTEERSEGCVAPGAMPEAGADSGASEEPPDDSEDPSMPSDDVEAGVPDAAAPSPDDDEDEAGVSPDPSEFEAGAAPVEAGVSPDPGVEPGAEAGTVATEAGAADAG